MTDHEHTDTVIKEQVGAKDYWATDVRNCIYFFIYYF